MTDQNAQPQRTKRGLDVATAAELGDLLHELTHGNKETRALIAKAIKKAKPDSPHANAFTDVELTDQFETFKREQEEARIKEQQEALVRQMNAKRQKLIEGDASGRKYSEDDVKKIEDLMQRKGIVDYDDGAVLYAATLPPVEAKPINPPPSQHGATWEFPEMETFGKDPVAASRNIAHQMIGEFMRKRG